MTFPDNAQLTKTRSEDRLIHSGIPADVSEKLGFVERPAPSAFSPAGVFSSAQLDKNALEPKPIRPEWVLEGNPQAMCRQLSAMSDHRGDVCHWSCTAGKFNWHYGWDEAVLFLEGRVEITDQKGNVYVGEPGVSLFFPAGTSAVWHVPDYIRKIAFNHNPVPRYLHLATRVVDKAGALVRRLMG